MLGGPIWSGPLHDQVWVNRALAMASSIPATVEGVQRINRSSSGEPISPLERAGPPGAAEGQGKDLGVFPPVCASSICREGENNGDNSQVLLSSVDEELLLAAELPSDDENALRFLGATSQQRATVPPATPRLAAGARAESLLRAVSQELNDVPLFYNLKDMFATMGLALHPKREQVRLFCMQIIFPMFHDGAGR